MKFVFYNFVEISTLNVNEDFPDTLSEEKSVISTESNYFSEVQSIK